MKRHIVAGLSIIGVALGVGWTLASHPGTSAGLDEISLNPSSEHSDPGPAKTLAGIRIRIMPSEFAGIRVRIMPTEYAGIRVRIMPSDGTASSASAKVPQIALVSE